MAVSGLLAQPSMAEPGIKSQIKKGKYQNRRLLVRYKDDTPSGSKARGHFSVGAYVVKSFETPHNLEVVEVARGISLDAAQEYYREDPNVLYVEPNHPLRALLEPPPTNPMPPDGGSGEPEEIDPRYSEQYGLNNEGQTGGTVDADINAPEMWEMLTGSKDVIVAVVDTGVNYGHPDLRRNIWTNPQEIPNNGIDDDNNGVVDDIHGFNAIDKSGDPMDDHGHGSHCAGIIGAEANNTYGGRGVMPDVSIIACKFLGADGGGTTEDAIACLEYLRGLKVRAEHPVNIFATSNSWGGGLPSQALQDAIQAHQDLGILFLAAASNDELNNDDEDSFPANYPLANIISVAATDDNDELSWFSNYGKRTVHVAAPGEDILSTVLNSDYEKMSGTSMATPFVTGLAGMIKAFDPSLNYMQVKNLLMAGGVPLDPLEDKIISGRRIRAVDENGLGSLTCRDQIVSGRLQPPQNYLQVPVGESVFLSAININCKEPNGDIVIPISPGKATIRLIDDGLGSDSAADDGMYTRDWLAEAPGQYEFIFPQNDKLVISVYDSATMRAYVKKDEEFNYRQFEGTALEADDDWSTMVRSPFPIRFGGVDQRFEMLNVGSNGAISVTNAESIDMINVALPAEKFMSLIAPFWDDLNPSASEGDVFYGTLGQAPEREFVIEWRKVRHYDSSGDATFQVVFFENSSDILFNYLDVDFGDELLNNGASATIGIQTTNDRVLQLSYDEASISSNQSMLFTLEGEQGDG